MQRLRFLVWKEFLELRMNPRLFGVVVVAPILQLTLLGYAATTDVRDVPMVVVEFESVPSAAICRTAALPSSTCAAYPAGTDSAIQAVPRSR